MNYTIKNIPTKKEVKKILISIKNTKNVNLQEEELNILKITSFLISNFETDKENIKDIIKLYFSFILNHSKELKEHNKDLFEICINSINLYDGTMILDHYRNDFFNYIATNNNTKKYFIII